jgi:DNA-binding NarL/FixJ family response regulator
MNAHDSRISGARGSRQTTHAPPHKGEGRRTRLLVLGEPELSRRGLRLLLKSYAHDLEVSEEEKLTTQAAEAADLVLLTLPVDMGSALSLVSDTAAALPDTPLLAHTTVADPANWARIMNRGARGGVLGPLTGIAILLAAVRLVAAGGSYIPPELILPAVVRRPMEVVAGTPPPYDDAGLTEREHAVLALIGRSATNHEIAAQLGITEATVRVHIRNLRQKLRARSRVDLALLAVRSPR